MNTPNHVFLEIEFLALVLFSIVLPIGIYWFLYQRASIARLSVIGFSVLLIAISGIDVFLLQTIAELSKLTTDNFDNRIFASELSIALYLLPAVFAGIAVNLLSHVLIDHLHRAESRHDREEQKR